MSVVVPVFNRPESVAGVIACLRGQSFTHWEVIFVDDGSDVDLLAAICPFLDDTRVRAVRLERNRGASAARNRGVSEARGRYVAFLDSDDGWHPDKLARQLAVMALLPADARAFCVTLTSVVMPGGWRRVRPNFPPQQSKSFGHYLYVQGGFAQVSSLLLPRFLALANRFHENLRQYEDHLLFIELHASGADYIVVPEVLTVWRNDVRQDRLSRQDDLDNGEAFLAAATDVLDPGVQVAFRLRALGGVLIRRRPRDAIKLFLFGLRQRVLSPRQIAVILARHMLPPRLWQLMVRPAQ
ncbi:glycosyltransferase family 2 protein [Lichenicoccus sp.]|uniref:glycosyltransferase family 2 protein n=1 Tax=Lichenicoccus sp. TaxID=2781899 RepID=UPI003D0BF1A4